MYIIKIYNFKNPKMVLLSQKSQGFETNKQNQHFSGIFTWAQFEFKLNRFSDQKFILKWLGR